jgi:hypothetical protein
MGIADVKEKLHDIIEHANEKKLQAIYTLLEDTVDDKQYEYDEETVKMLEERREEYLSGKVKGLSVEEANELIKKQLKGGI